MNPYDSEDPAAFHLRNKHELLYECRFVGQYVPDKEHRSAEPDILYRRTENNGNSVDGLSSEIDICNYKRIRAAVISKRIQKFSTG